jgi:hypothetical protein
MGHADIATTMIYVHHVPQIDPADKLSQLVTEAQKRGSGTRSGHGRRAP